MAVRKALLAVGDVSARSGLPISTLHYYEAQGLIDSQRTPGNQRRYERTVLRRLAVIQAGRAVGISLSEIRDALAILPDNRVPNKRDWDRMGREWHLQIQKRISLLEKLRDDLASCIGCGCLSEKSCSIMNSQSAADIGGLAVG